MIFTIFLPDKNQFELFLQMMNFYGLLSEMRKYTEYAKITGDFIVML